MAEAGPDADPSGADPGPSTRPVVYLAGPDVFLPDATVIGAAKVAVCERHGLDGRFPLDAPVADGVGAAPHEQGRAFFEACAEMMDDCDAGIANLTPFRGISADVGTTFELGYLLGQGKPVFGYTAEPAHYQDRVAPDGLFVEPFELADNLMLEGAVMRSGVRIVRRVEPGSDGHGRLVAMAALEACVAEAARVLGAVD